MNNFFHRLIAGVSSRFGSGSGTETTEYSNLTDMQAFIRRFEQKYGQIHPTIYDGGFRQAMDVAKRELHFLLVYMHANQNAQADKLCKEVLCKQDVVDFIDSNMMFWACSSTTIEGSVAVADLSPPSYPFLSVLVLRDNTMATVARIVGFIDDRALLTRLEKIITDNHHYLDAEHAIREEYRLNQTLRRQQDEEYEESLFADQLKAKQKQAEIDRLAAVDGERQERLEIEKKRREELCELKVESGNLLCDEPASNDPDAICLVIKLPSGIRLERHFNRTHSLEQLFYYVLLSEAAPDYFEIIKLYPRRVLPCDPRHADTGSQLPTFAAIGLGKSEVVYVQNIEA